MTERLAGMAENFLSSLGRAFFISGYAPALLFVGVNQYLLFSPALGGQPLNLFTDIADPLLGFLDGEILTTLLLPMLLGILLLALNTPIIHFYEGLLPFQKVLLYPLYRAKLRQQQEQYGDLEAKREAYHALLRGGGKSGERELREAITIQHEQAETISRRQVLPRMTEKVTPTWLGNAYAVIEEYPFERYGMDGVLFWPRLRPLISGEHKSLLDNQKVMLDMLLNFSLGLGVIAVESVILALSRGEGIIWVVGAVALFLAWVFYQAGVAAVRSMEPVVTQCFDIYREALLKEFGLELPDDMAQERKLWLRLAAFIRRGEPFYFPKK